MILYLLSANFHLIVANTGKKKFELIHVSVESMFKKSSLFLVGFFRALIAAIFFFLVSKAVKAFLQTEQFPSVQITLVKNYCNDERAFPLRINLHLSLRAFQRRQSETYRTRLQQDC